MPDKCPVSGMPRSALPGTGYACEIEIEEWWKIGGPLSFHRGRWNAPTPNSTGMVECQIERSPDWTARAAAAAREGTSSFRRMTAT